MNRKPRPSWHRCEADPSRLSGETWPGEGTVRRFSVSCSWKYHASNTFLLMFSPNPLVFSWKTTSVSTFLSASPLLLLSPPLSPTVSLKQYGWSGEGALALSGQYSPTSSSGTSHPQSAPPPPAPSYSCLAGLERSRSASLWESPCSWDSATKPSLRVAEMEVMFSGKPGGLRFQEEANMLTLQKEEGSTGAERNSSSLCGCGLFDGVDSVPWKTSGPAKSFYLLLDFSMDPVPEVLGGVLPSHPCGFGYFEMGKSKNLDENKRASHLKSIMKWHLKKKIGHYLKVYFCSI